MAEKLVTTNDFDATTPGDGDDVIVVDYNVQHIDTGLDQKGDDYASLTIAEGFDKNLGSSGTPLKMCCDDLRDLGSGDAYYEANDNNVAGDDALDDVLIQKGRNDAKAVFSMGTPIQATCLGHRFSLMRGHHTFEAGFIFGSAAHVAIGYVANRGSDSLCKIEAESGAGTTLPDLEVNGGRVICNRTVTRCSIAGAEMTVDLKPIATLDILAGGIVKYNHDSSTKIIVHGGGLLILDEKIQIKSLALLVLCEGAQIRGYHPNLHTGTLLDYRYRST